MNYAGLREIIKSIKTNVSCPSCENSYGNEDLAIVSALDERCVVVAQCSECKAAILVTAVLKTVPEQREEIEERLHIRNLQSGATISADDIVDLHEALQNFSGDIRQLVE